MKLTKLILENFQSHSYTELELAATLTVIVGESDQGKSAVARALQWLLLNEPRGADFIRVGSDGCKVTGYFADGTKLTRERSRSGSKNRYIITEPQGAELVLDGIGTGVPPEVTAITGVKPLVLEGRETLNVNFGGQLEAPFLLSENGHTRARAIGRLTGTHLFDQARQRSALEARRAEQQAKRLGEEAERVSEELAGFADVPLLEEALQSLERLLARLGQVETRREILIKLLASWQSLEQDLAREESILAQLANLDQVRPPLAEAAEKAGRASQLAILKLRLKEIQGQTALADILIQATHGLNQARASIAEVEALPLAALLRLAIELAQIEGGLAKAGEYLPRFRGIDEASAKATAGARAQATWQTLLQLKGRAAETQAHLGYLQQTLDRAEDIRRGAELVESLNPRLLTRLRELAAMYQTNRREIAASDEGRLAAEQKMASQVGEYTRALTAAGQCPLCSSTIDQEAVVRIAKEQLQGGATDGGDLGAADKPA
jgi:exonuclease SbcC